MSPQQITVLRRGFVDICRGFSEITYKGEKIYVRHLSHREHLEYDLLQRQFEEERRAQGGKYEKEKLDALIAKGLWSAAKDREIEEVKDFILRLEEGRKVISQLSVMRNQERQIEEEQKKLNELLGIKRGLIGMTVELYAQTALNDYYIVTNLFKEPTLQTLVFERADFDNLPDLDVEEVLQVYEKAIEPCNDDNLKCMTVQDFFMSYYSLSNDDPMVFYGKPVCNLTYYQVRLMNVARYFRSILQDLDLSKVDAKTKNDPNAIERLYLARKNASEMEAQGKVPANMSQEDIKALGMEGKFAKIDKEMSGQELIKHLQKGGR